MKTPPPFSDDDLNALFAAARADKPDTSRAEYGFETRLMARLATTRRQRWFSRWTWKLAPLCAALLLGVLLWTRNAPPPPPPAQDEQVEALLEWSISGEDDLGGSPLADLFSPS